MTTARTPQRAGERIRYASTRRFGLPAAPPEGSRRREWLDPRKPVMAATLTAAVLHIIWAVFLATDGGDIAAQAAWTGWARKFPDTAFNLAWYGGMHPANYSVLSPYLMGWAGIRTVATVTGTLSATLTALLLVRFKAPMAMPAAIWAAFALSCNSASGRVTFGLGLLFALAAVFPAYAGGRGTPMLRAVGMFALGVLATLASPVAGLFVMVLAAALILTGRRRAGIALALGPPIVVATTSLLFPFYGNQPISTTAIVLPTLASVLAILICAPKSWKVVRVGAGVYLLGILLTWVIPSPIGSNVERLALIFGAMFLIAAMVATPLSDKRRLVVLGLALAVTAVWQVVKPVDDLIHTRPAAATASHSKGLIEELERLGAANGRVEVVPLRSHWEAFGLSRKFVLARGWNRQVDAERNSLFYEDKESLDPVAYRDWLHKWAVQFVVLPEREVDWAARHEAAVVRGDQSFLNEVWRDPHWRLYKVASPTALVDAPATVDKIRADKVVVDAPNAGSVLLRISWSPWLSVHGPGSGCVAPAGDFVRLHLPKPGHYTIGATYKIPRGTPCKD